MEPLSAAALSALANGILVQVGKALGAVAVKGIKRAKTRVFGDPERKALTKALRRAFDETRATHGPVLAEYDLAGKFLEEAEVAAELAKAVVPGRQPSAARLAERCIDGTGAGMSYDERWDRISAVRPVFKTLLEALASEVRQEPALAEVTGRVDTTATADAATRLVEHLGAAPSGDEDEAAYLRWLTDQHRYVRTAGMVRKTMLQLPLYEVFVGLSAQRDPRPGDLARDWFGQERRWLEAMRESGKLEQTAFEAELDRLQLRHGRRFTVDAEPPADQAIPVLDAVDATRHLLVLGAPGSGKTTLLRYLALRAAHGLAAADRRNAPFPIYLRLGDYARRTQREVGIGEYLPGYLRSLECRTPGLEDLLRRRLDGGGCLVLLDGLDEVASADERRAVVEAVGNFVAANTRPGNRFVVTSRISGYLAAPLPEPFGAVRLRDMDDPTITRFLDVYCREVERAETPNKSDAAILRAAQQEATSVREALRDNAGVRRLAANPLLLAALVLVHRASGRLPHRRVEAYQEVCNALGRTWRRVQEVEQAALPDERVLTRWLTELGAWIHEHRPEGSATKREVLRVLGPLWAAHAGSAWDPEILRAADPMDSDAGRGVVDFLEKVDTHTGLLVEQAPGRYGFPHLTFEEYYAGRALVFRGAVTERAAGIRARLHDPRYDEPILLALGMIGTEHPEEVEQLVAEAVYPATSNPSRYEHLLGRDFLFMLRVLADDIPLETATIDRIVNQALDEWFTPDSSRCRFTVYRNELSRKLAALGTTTAATRLRHTIGARADTAGRTSSLLFCQLMAALSRRLRPPEPAIAALAELATSAEDSRVRVAAVDALAPGGVLLESVVAVLEGLATSAKDSDVRVAAVKALALGGALSESTEAAAVELATSAEDPFGHTDAVGALAYGSASRQPAVTSLVGLETTAADRWVRTEAVRALARGYEGLSESVVDVLVGLATSAEDPAVRVAAVDTLAGGAALPEPVVAAAVESTTSTEDPAVRVAAVKALARGGALSGSVVDVLMGLIAPTEDPAVRVAAVKALVGGGVLSEPVMAAAVGLASAKDPHVRADAVMALAGRGALSEPAVSALVGLAISAEDLFVRVLAVKALVDGGQALPEPVAAATLNLATSAESPRVRAEAVEALSRSGDSPEAVVAAAVDLATTSRFVLAREMAVRALGLFEPNEHIREVILSAFGDSEGFVRGTARITLVRLARQHPGTAHDLANKLAAACEDPNLGIENTIGWRPGWDYAQEVLRTIVDIAGSVDDDS